LPDVRYAWAIINKNIGAWPPSEMEGMTLDELYDWYDIACEIQDAETKANK